MTNISALDIAISLVFIYLLYSMLGTIIQELLATIFSFRSKLLERAIFRMLEDSDIFDKKFRSLKVFFKIGNQQLKQEAQAVAKAQAQAQAQVQAKAIKLFYDHPLIKYLSEDTSKSKPSYITKEAFSKVMIDLLKGENAKLGDDLKPFIENSIKNKTFGTAKVTISNETHKFLRSIWLESQGDVVAFRKLLEKWFDDTMERCTGWYKKKTEYILLVIGLVIAILFNVDTISIASKLHRDPQLCEMVVQQAYAYTKAHPNLPQERDTALKNVEREVKITLQNDTTKQYTKLDSLKLKNKLDSIAKAKSDSLIKRGVFLSHRADSLINSDIAKLNTTMGLGWINVWKEHSYTVPKEWKWGESKSLDKNKSKFKCLVKQFPIWAFEWLVVLLKWLSTIIGWIITALAISLGAPFWFDLLNKLMKLRGSVSSSNSTQNKEKLTEDDKVSAIIRKG